MITHMPLAPFFDIRPGWLAGVCLVGAIGLVGCQSPSATEEVVATTAATDSDGQAAMNEEVDAAQQQAREANRQLEIDKQTLQLAAWQHVKAIVGMWDELPPEFFPGLTDLVEQTEALRTKIEQEESIQVGLIDPRALTTNNPAFWRAVMETNPEDPVVEMFEQMLWAARGDFDRAVWLIELNRYGPALPTNVHKLIYSMADEMRNSVSKKRDRSSAGKRCDCGPSITRMSCLPK